MGSGDQATYVLALSETHGIGPRSIIRMLKYFPDLESLTSAPDDLLVKNLGADLSSIVQQRFLAFWRQILESSRQLVQEHIEKKIIPLVITDSHYPPLLRLIPDPPPILFVRGKLDTLTQADAIAIVGTRDATEKGKEVAVRVAKHFGKNGYVIVSGLAKGIDTAAHQAALEVGAKTVAVLGTALDQIYPAENRTLAEQIAGDSGAIISELPLRKKSFRNAFVQRDRIQSGMSLAVIPVQTDIEGGTMHTVRFAEAQNRLLFCPKPLAVESHVKQYAGILELVRTHRAIEFQGEDYGSLQSLLLERKRKLLGSAEVMAEMPVETAVGNEPQVPEGKKAPKKKRQRALEFPEVHREKFTANREDVEKLVELIHQAKLDDPSRFDQTMRAVRKQLFGTVKPKRKKD
jgi:DNA processing protein